MSRNALWVGFVFTAFCSTTQGQDSAIPGSPVVPAGYYQQSGVAPLFHRRQVCPVYPDCPPLAPGTPGMPGTPVDPNMPPTTNPPDLSGLTSPFATGTEGGGLQGRSFNEAFDGDFGGVFYCKDVIVGTNIVTVQTGTRQETRVRFIDGVPQRFTVTVPVFSNIAVPKTVMAQVPVPGRYTGIMITDNDSPRPTDRFYFNYNYYDGINAS